MLAPSQNPLKTEIQQAHIYLNTLRPAPTKLVTRIRPILRRLPISIGLPLVSAGLVWLGFLNNNFDLFRIGGCVLLGQVGLYIIIILLDVFKEQPDQEFLRLSEYVIDRQTDIVSDLQGLKPETLKYMHTFYSDQIAAVESGMVLLLGPLRTLGLAAWFAAFLAAYSALVQALPDWKNGAPYALALAVGLAFAGLRAEEGLQAMRRRRDLLARVLALSAK